MGVIKDGINRICKAIKIARAEAANAKRMKKWAEEAYRNYLERNGYDEHWTPEMEWEEAAIRDAYFDALDKAEEEMIAEAEAKWAKEKEEAQDGRD